MEDIDMELLISLVENRPVLWDKTQDYYKNKQSSFAAWREICLALNGGFESMSEKERNDFGREIIKKWNNARDNWMKYHKKIKECKSGSGAKHLRKYKFCDQMHFLRKIFDCRPSEASITRTLEKNIIQSHKNEPSAPDNTATPANTTAAANTTTPIHNIAPVNTAALANTAARANTAALTHTASPTNTATPANTSTIKTSKKRKTDSSEVDQMLTFIKSVEDEYKSKSMCFFKGIAPIVDKYSDNDYLEFQYEVIKVMRNLTRRNQASMQQQNYNYNIKIEASPDYMEDEYQQTQPVPSTSRMKCEIEPKPDEPMQEDDSQFSINY